MRKIIVGMFIMANIIRVCTNVEASENQEFIITNQVVEDGFVEEIDEEEISVFSTKINIDWSVKPKIIKKTKTFTMKSGKKIYLNLKIIPNKKVRIGIIKGEKEKQYYETTTGLEKEITIKESNTYRVFVQNMTNQTIRVIGNYTK